MHEDQQRIKLTHQHLTQLIDCIITQQLINTDTFVRLQFNIIFNTRNPSKAKLAMNIFPPSSNLYINLLQPLFNKDNNISYPKIPMNNCISRLPVILIDGYVVEIQITSFVNVTKRINLIAYFGGNYEYISHAHDEWFHVKFNS